MSIIWSVYYRTDKLWYTMMQADDPEDAVEKFNNQRNKKITALAVFNPYTTEVVWGEMTLEEIRKEIKKDHGEVMI